MAVAQREVALAVRDAPCERPGFARVLRTVGLEKRYDRFRHHLKCRETGRAITTLGGLDHLHAASPRDVGGLVRRPVHGDQDSREKAAGNRIERRADRCLFVVRGNDQRGLKRSGLHCVYLGSRASLRLPVQRMSRKSTMRAAFLWLRDLLLSVVIAVIVILFLYQPVKVEGTSMMPTLEDQERIFINKFIYRLGVGDIERGDTIVFYFPHDPAKSYIKRVIGLPGDRVEVERGRVRVNGFQIDEPYVPDEYRDTNSAAPLTVPEGQYYVLGDHRSSSNDSRSWGTVPRRFVYGKAVFIYWPIEKIGVLR
jgi:signal peptidase I